MLSILWKRNGLSGGEINMIFLNIFLNKILCSPFHIYLSALNIMEKERVVWGKDKHDFQTNI